MVKTLDMQILFFRNTISCSLYKANEKQFFHTCFNVVMYKIMGGQALDYRGDDSAYWFQGHLQNKSENILTGTPT